jgi:hypothetical protein
MIHENLTILYYTANLISDFFRDNMLRQLKIAIGDTPIVSVSQKPMDLGENICVGPLERSSYNIYKQVLIAAKAAKTKYVATAEDDALYPKEYFEYRPADDVFAYCVNKWGIYTWVRPPIMSYRERRTMVAMISTREALIKTLEERFAKYPDIKTFPLAYFGEPGRFEGHMGLTGVKSERFKSPIPIIVYTHEEAIAFVTYLRWRKGHSKIRALEVAPWGKAEDLLKLYQPRQNV